MDLSGVLNAANPGSTTNTNSSTKLGGDFNQFLRLLTTQLQNQDPLSPLDTAEFTNQLVQFSNVEQNIRSNDYLQKLLTLQSLNLTSVGLSYVGLSVQTPGNTFQFDGQHVSALAYNMATAGAVGTFSIVNENGDVVYTQQPELSKGLHNFAWDGRDNEGEAVPPGTYKMLVSAQDSDGESVSVTSLVPGTVSGVQTADDGEVMLMIDDKLIPVTDVRQATLPGFAPSGTDVAG